MRLEVGKGYTTKTPAVMTVLFLIWVMDIQMFITLFFIIFYSPDIICN